MKGVPIAKSEGLGRFDSFGIWPRSVGLLYLEFPISAYVLVLRRSRHTSRARMVPTKTAVSNL